MSVTMQPNLPGPASAASPDMGAAPPTAAPSAGPSAGGGKLVTQVNKLISSMMQSSEAELMPAFQALSAGIEEVVSTKFGGMGGGPGAAGGGPPRAVPTGAPSAGGPM